MQCDNTPTLYFPEQWRAACCSEVTCGLQSSLQCALKEFTGDTCVVIVVTCACFGSKFSALLGLVRLELHLNVKRERFCPNMFYLQAVVPLECVGTLLLSRGYWFALVKYLM